MRHLRTLAIILFSICWIFTVGCKKHSDNTTTDNTENYTDGLTEEEDAVVVNASAPRPGMTQLLDRHGKLYFPPNKPSSTSNTDNPDILDLLILDMLEDAQTLCDQKSVVHISDGINRPTHNGIAYSLGS